jgi:RHS repeat-associated protein
VLRNVEYLPNRTEIHTDRAGNRITFQKDDWGNVIRQSDGEGNETVTSYNPQNKPASVTDPAGVVTNFEYDTTGTYLTREIQASGKPEQVIIDYTYTAFGEIQSKSTGGATTSYTYNDFGLPSTITDQLGNVTYFEYDQYGNVSATTDASGNRSTFAYDILGNLLESKDPLGNRTIYTYNSLGRLTSIKDALNRTTQYETDFKGRLTAVIDPLNNRKEYDYDGSGNLVKITEGAAITSLAYDSADRISSMTDAEGNTTTYEYSTAAATGGNVSTPAKVRDPLGNFVEYSFDKSGKTKGIKDPLLNLTSLAYDAGGRVSSHTDANGNSTTYEYDGLGRATKQTDARGGVISFQYDSRGNLTSLSDPNGQTTTFEYDLADQKTKETNPLGQFTEYTYYSNGLLETVKDGKGQISTYAYDAAGRLISVTYADGKQDSFTYDAVGNLLTYANESVSGALTYDALNRKLSESVNYGPFAKTYSYTYDARGNKASYTSPEGVVYSYAYNLNNQPTSISFAGNTIALNYQWNRLVSSTLPNGITTDYQYNANSWLTYITAEQGAATLSEYTYSFDNVGNITNKNTEHGNYSYSYDTTYQLTNSISPFLQEPFTYDNTRNRQSDSSSPVNLAFGTTQYIYDSRNRLERVNLPDARTAVYAYDPFGRRVKKNVAGQVTYYAYSDEGLIGEYEEAGTLQKAYGWQPDSIWGTDPVFVVENGHYYFYHNDHLGAPQKLTDINGNTVWTADYTAFGKAQVQVASIENNLRFPGQYYDAETGLHYNWNRYYNPASGRYTQTDPIGFSAGDENLYGYAYSNPLSYIDPEGLLADTILDITFLGYDLYRLATSENECDFDEQLTALKFDLVGLTLPFVSGLGTAYRNGKALKKGLNEYDLWTKEINSTRGLTAERKITDIPVLNSYEYGVTPKGRPLTEHYSFEQGPKRNIPVSVVDHVIDKYTGIPVGGGKKAHYDPINDVTVITGTNDSIVSARKGKPRKGQY